jgi:hypothetical protein
VLPLVDTSTPETPVVSVPFDPVLVAGLAVVPGVWAAVVDCPPLLVVEAVELVPVLAPEVVLLLLRLDPAVPVDVPAVVPVCVDEATVDPVLPEEEVVPLVFTPNSFSTP